MNIFDCRSELWSEGREPVLSIGDKVAVIDYYGNEIRAIVIKADTYGECSDSCPYLNLYVCHMIPCDSLITFKAIDDEDQIIDDNKFTLKSIKEKICNLDICMYYEENCDKYKIGNKSNSNFCLLRRIIE